MKIYLKNIKYYYLTHKNPKRKKHILEEFKKYNLIEVNPNTDIKGKNKSGSNGFCKILDLACRNQNNTLPFQPFVILEDDVKKFREFPETIEIPNNTDIFYIGLSKFSLTDKKKGDINKAGAARKSLSYKEINKDIIRIYNMVSLHGTIICSPSGAIALHKCMMEAFFKNISWDNFACLIQPYYNVYALKIPLVYQYKAIGGAEYATKYKLNDFAPTPKQLPEKWKNKDNISVIMCQF